MSSSGIPTQLQQQQPPQDPQKQQQQQQQQHFQQLPHQHLKKAVSGCGNGGSAAVSLLRELRGTLRLANPAARNSYHVLQSEERHLLHKQQHELELHRRPQQREAEDSRQRPPQHQPLPTELQTHAEGPHQPSHRIDGFDLLPTSAAATTESAASQAASSYLANDHDHQPSSHQQQQQAPLTTTSGEAPDKTCLQLTSAPYSIPTNLQQLQQQSSQIHQQQQHQSHPSLGNGFSFNRVLGGAASSSTIRCVVLMLDDSRHVFDVGKRWKGGALLGRALDSIAFPAVERDYFGLQFADRQPTGTPTNTLRWLDAAKSIRKQLGAGSPPYLLYLRVKFYAADPCALHEELARYLFVLQIKKDILEGRLVVPQPTAILLASYVVQSDLGDFNPEEHLHGYLADMRLVPNQTEELEAKIAELHRMHRGQFPAEAEMNFLAHAKRLDMYGVDLHRARVSAVQLLKYLNHSRQRRYAVTCSGGARSNSRSSLLHGVHRHAHIQQQHSRFRSEQLSAEPVHIYPAPTTQPSFDRAFSGQRPAASQRFTASPSIATQTGQLQSNHLHLQQEQQQQQQQTHAATGSASGTGSSGYSSCCCCGTTAGGCCVGEPDTAVQLRRNLSNNSGRRSVCVCDSGNPCNDGDNHNCNAAGPHSNCCNFSSDHAEEHFLFTESVVYSAHLPSGNEDSHVSSAAIHDVSSAVAVAASGVRENNHNHIHQPVNNPSLHHLRQLEQPQQAVSCCNHVRPPASSIFAHGADNPIPLGCVCPVSNVAAPAVNVPVNHDVYPACTPHTVAEAASSARSGGSRRIFRKGQSLSRGSTVFLSASNSIRKSFRRLPRMMAQLTHVAAGGRSGAYGASTNASDEFIVHKVAAGLVAAADDQATSANPAAPACSGRPSASAVSLIGNGLSSELINPLCMDSKQADIHLGVTSQGLVVFQNNIKMNTFSWAKIIKISFKKKQFFIQLRKEGDEEYDSLLGFNMQSYRSSKNLWQSCVEHHAFFRLQSSGTRPVVPSRRLFPLNGSFFHIGSKFRYSGRSVFETMREAEYRHREKLEDVSNAVGAATANRAGAPATCEDDSLAMDPWMRFAPGDACSGRDPYLPPNSQGPSVPAAATSAASSMMTGMTGLTTVVATDTSPAVMSGSAYNTGVHVPSLPLPAPSQHIVLSAQQPIVTSGVASPPRLRTPASSAAPTTVSVVAPISSTNTSAPYRLQQQQHPTSKTSAPAHNRHSLPPHLGQGGVNVSSISAITTAIATGGGCTNVGHQQQQPASHQHLQASGGTASECHRGSTSREASPGRYGQIAGNGPGHTRSHSQPHQVQQQQQPAHRDSTQMTPTRPSTSDGVSKATHVANSCGTRNTSTSIAAVLTASPPQRQQQQQKPQQLQQQAPSVAVVSETPSTSLHATHQRSPQPPSAQPPQQSQPLVKGRGAYLCTMAVHAQPLPCTAGLANHQTTPHSRPSQVHDDHRRTLTPRKAWTGPTTDVSLGSVSINQANLKKQQQGRFVKGQNTSVGKAAADTSALAAQQQRQHHHHQQQTDQGSVAVAATAGLAPQAVRGDPVRGLRYADEDDSPEGTETAAGATVLVTGENSSLQQQHQNVSRTCDTSGAAVGGLGEVGTAHAGVTDSTLVAVTTLSSSSSVARRSNLSDNLQLPVETENNELGHLFYTKAKCCNQTNITNLRDTIKDNVTETNGVTNNISDHISVSSNKCGSGALAQVTPNLAPSRKVAVKDPVHSPASTVSYLSSPSSDSIGGIPIIKICLTPDAHGRFGFSVKGGRDQNNAAVVVSRVLPGAPADQATPRLRVGDEVVAINDHDVLGLTHEQVVSLVHDSWNKKKQQELAGVKSHGVSETPRDSQAASLAEGSGLLASNATNGTTEQHMQRQKESYCSKEFESAPKGETEIAEKLVLSIRPQAFALGRTEPGTGSESEPFFRYTPQSPEDLESPRVAPAASIVLRESMLLLKECLLTGSLLVQFEQLYRKKPGMTCSVSKLPVNASRNRYKDISPYDKTRVVLATDATNTSDYINASYVIMKVPSSGIVNRYIATQGPLQTTTRDFWQMVWEQQSTLVVMLTTLVEKSRIKCHKYWPSLYETHSYGRFQVSCVSEQETASFAFREFSLTTVDSAQEERHISHMQYLAWPDHGVPDDATDFLEFISRVRSARDAMVEPTIVHCSAGIGRTGVLILMETAMALIEANEPVYPLEITRTMRDQRAMLIQTASQYKFVCEAILKVFREGIAKPLPEYQRL